MTSIKVQPLPEVNKYRLIETVEIAGFIIPEGFEWDGASIPRILWEQVGSPYQPKFMAPSLVHDFLYHKGESKTGISRKGADKLFKALLIQNGVSKDLAESMYTGVRIGGKAHFNWG